MKYLYIVLTALCLSALTGARPAVMGHATGRVTAVDNKAGIVSVDLGKTDGVIKGLKFAVLDRKGLQVATVVAKDVYADLFWSDKIPHALFDRMDLDMEVRWVLTTETAMLLDARKKNTTEAYRNFLKFFPASKFLPELIKDMPDSMLEQLDPDYYRAWKTYTKESLREFVKRHPHSGLKGLAESEIKSLEAYDAEQKRLIKERAERAEAYEAERKRREEIENRVKSMSEMASRKEMMGKLTNNTDKPVLFVFLPPSDLPPETVMAKSKTEVRHTAGSYSYKIYAVEDKPAPAVPGTEPVPLKEGTVDIQYDFWELAYP